MIFSQERGLRLFVESTNDNFNFHPFLEFNKSALFRVLSNGLSEMDFVFSILNSLKELNDDPNGKKYRLKLRSNTEEYFIYDECPIKKISLTNSGLSEGEKKSSHAQFKLLTPKELEILNLMFVKKSRENVNIELNMKKSTLNVHLKKIYKKLEVHSFRELLKWGEGYYKSKVDNF